MNCTGAGERPGTGAPRTARPQFPSGDSGGENAGCGGGANGPGLGGGTSWAGSKSSHPSCGRRDQTISGTNVDAWSRVGPQEPGDLKFSLQRSGGGTWLGVLVPWPFKERLSKRGKGRTICGGGGGGRMRGAPEIWKMGGGPLRGRSSGSGPQRFFKWGGASVGPASSEPRPRSAGLGPARGRRRGK